MRMRVYTVVAALGLLIGGTVDADVLTSLHELPGSEYSFGGTDYISYELRVTTPESQGGWVQTDFYLVLSEGHFFNWSYDLNPVFGTPRDPLTNVDRYDCFIASSDPGHTGDDIAPGSQPEHQYHFGPAFGGFSSPDDPAPLPGNMAYCEDGSQVFSASWADTSVEGAGTFAIARMRVSLGAKGTAIGRSIDSPDGATANDAVPFELSIGGPVTGTPPIADADGPYEEGDWTGGPGSYYNDPLREIVLDASGTTPTDGDPILNYTWYITNTYDPANPVTPIDAGTSDTFTLKLGDLLGDLPPDHHVAADNLFDVVLTATDKDGSSSDGTTLFVPEPATLALLGFGGIAALIRRRRR